MSDYMIIPLKHWEAYPALYGRDEWEVVGYSEYDNTGIPRNVEIRRHKSREGI